jgi:hypothetical protein
VQSSNLRRLAPLLIAAALAACESAPQPFAHAPGPARNPLLVMPDRAGIVVLEVDGAPERASRALAAEMAKALLDGNVPATTQGGNRSSSFLQGRANVREVGGGQVEVALVWDLVDAKGRPVGTRTATRIVDGGAWRDGARTAVAALVADSAPAVAALVQEPAPVARRDPVEGRPIRVAAIEGAPPAAERAMRLHMQDALRRTGFALAEDDTPDPVTVGGKVQVGPEANGAKRIEIAWTVRQADGTELGNLKQGNVVESAELEGDWGQIARLSTAGAAGGIADLLRGIDAIRAGASRE